MKILKEIKNVYLDSNSETILLSSDNEGNRISGTAYIQLSDASDVESITIEGKLTKSESVMQIGAISLADYKAVDEITEAGIYLIPIDGLNKIILTADGSADVTLKIIED